MKPTTMTVRRIHWGPDRIFILCILILIPIYFHGCSRAPLKPWHTQPLSEEFTTRKTDDIATFEAYRNLEDRLFAQLEDKVYEPIEVGSGHELFRFSSGSMADPLQRTPNWNRSFELVADTPVGGVLLLHSKSDSPYSLRALGESFNRLAAHEMLLNSDPDPLTKKMLSSWARFYPIVAKAGGLQSQGDQGRSRSKLLQVLGNAGSGVLRLSRRVIKMVKIDPIL